MDRLSNHERKKRGTDAFPLDLYNVTKGHPRYDMPYHWHKEVEFVLVHSGSFNTSLDGVEYTLTSGDALYISSGVIHGGTPDDCVYDCIVFDRDTLLFQSEIVRKTIKEIEGRGRISPCFKDGSGLANIYIKELFLSAGRRDEGYEMGTMSALLGFYSQAIAEGRVTLGERDELVLERLKRLRHALDYIEENYRNHITLEDIAKCSGYSPKYFCRYFYQAVHKTPIEYLNFYRVERACFMLDTESCTVGDAAYKCGFNDLGYFIRTFKRLKGITPKKYSKRGNYENYSLH